MPRLDDLIHCAPPDCVKLPGLHDLLAGAECKVARRDHNVQDPHVHRDTRRQVNDQHGALKILPVFRHC
eukprot:4039204-Lingulodinium_polyedra.AAC.1